MSDVVVVESPAKAKTINKYLGGGYTVLASFGHVRDLPPKDGSVRPDENFAMDWAADERGQRQVSAIARRSKAQSDSISQPTRIAKARRSPGMSKPCWRKKIC
jgi:DNA topoisomerase IA